MTMIRQLSSILLMACIVATNAWSETGGAGWRVEKGTETPSYAAVEPRRTNLNIDMVVLACEQAGEERILQLQLYLTDDGPLRPMDQRSRVLKDDPYAEISIDGRIFPAELMFADDFAVLADAHEGWFPLLSNRLLAAMQTGRTMTLHLDLLAEPPGQAPSFDGAAVVDLEGGGGHQAIAAVRRCASPTHEGGLGTALLQH